MSFEDVEASGVSVSTKIQRKDNLAEGVFKITTAVATYSRLANTLGTPKDTPELRENLHKMRVQISQLIKDTTEKLRRASQFDKQSEISANKRIADAKLARDFKAVMQEFQKVQNLAAQREMSYAPFIPQTSYSGHTAERKSDSDKKLEQKSAVVQANRQELVLLENEILFNEGIIEERDQSIREIQQQIGEVSEIFKDLAVMVHEQGGTVETITVQIENTAVATGEAKDDLVKASKSQQSGNSLVCLLLVIFGIVLLIIIIVLAT